MDAPGPLSDGNLLDSPGVPQPAPGDLMSRAPLSAEEFQPSVKGGIDLLSRYEREAPSIQNPAIQRFQDIAFRWLPTDDKALQGARARAQASADQLARLRLAAETQAQQYPWETFVAEMLAPRETPGFTSALSATMKAVGEEKRKRAGLARELGLKEAEAGATRATQEERAEMERIRAGADLVQSAANMQRAARTYQQQGEGALTKLARELNVDPSTPEGQLQMRRMWMIKEAKGDPDVLRALATDQELDPFSPEASKAILAQRLLREQKAEQEAKRKLTREERKDVLAEQAAARSAKAADVALETARLNMDKVRQQMEQAAKGGVSGGKMPAEIQRQQLAIRGLKTGLDAYEQALEGIDPRSLDQLSPSAQAKIQSILADLTITWKEVAALGALTGPDVGLINRALTDPFSVKGAWYGKGGLKEQLKQARESMGRKISAFEEQYGTVIEDKKPTTPSAWNATVGVQVKIRKDGRTLMVTPEKAEALKKSYGWEVIQ